jgi:multimeric flavodoxin WrbA
MTRVVAVNGSPNMEKGLTELILRPFLEGMTEAGAEVDVFYAKRLDIKPCKGALYCWDANPGKCHIKDDMQSIYPVLKRADILVLATPVYIPLPGEMQNFVNRLVPLLDPILRRRNGRTRARFRSDVRIRKIVLLSTCGWYEKGNFGTVVRIVKELASDASVQFVGALVRPHASILARGGPKVDKVIKAAKKYGHELVTTGKISKRLIEEVGTPLVSE